MLWVVPKAKGLGEGRAGGGGQNEAKKGGGKSPVTGKMILDREMVSQGEGGMVE